MRVLTIITLVAVVAVTIVSSGKVFTECMDNYFANVVDLYKKDQDKFAKADCLESFKKDMSKIVAKLTDEQLETREVTLTYKMLPVIENFQKCLVGKGLDVNEVGNQMQKVIDDLMAEFKDCQLVN